MAFSVTPMWNVKRFYNNAGKKNTNFLCAKKNNENAKWFQLEDFEMEMEVSAIRSSVSVAVVFGPLPQPKVSLGPAAAAASSSP